MTALKLYIMQGHVTLVPDVAAKCNCDTKNTFKRMSVGSSSFHLI